MTHSELDQRLLIYKKEKSTFFDLENEELLKYNFLELDLSGCLFKSNTVVSCILNKTNLYDGYLSETEFRDCIFLDCDLSCAILYRTKFINTTFINCKLIKCDAQETIIKDSQFIGCDLNFFDFRSGLITSSKLLNSVNIDFQSIEGDGFLEFSWS